MSAKDKRAVLQILRETSGDAEHGSVTPSPIKSVSPGKKKAGIDRSQIGAPIASSFRKLTRDEAIEAMAKQCNDAKSPSPQGNTRSPPPPPPAAGTQSAKPSPAAPPSRAS